MMNRREFSRITAGLGALALHTYPATSSAGIFKQYPEAFLEHSFGRGESLTQGKKAKRKRID